MIDHRLRIRKGEQHSVVGWSVYSTDALGADHWLGMWPNKVAADMYILTAKPKGKPRVERCYGTLRLPLDTESGCGTYSVPDEVAA